MFRPLPPWPTLYMYSGLTAFVLAVVLVPITILILRRLRVVDDPADNKIHKTPIPRGGGIAIFIAFAVAVLLPDYRDNPMKGVMAGAFICLVVGAIDDFRGGIPAVVKFLALICSTIVMSYFGLRLDLFENETLNLLVTIVWVVGVTSAFNGIDNMDGLASGVCVVASAMFLVIALQAHYSAGTETSLAWFGLLAAGLIGSNLGFLIYNVKPARVFMGDSGSFFLGFMVSALGVMGEWAANPVISCTIPILILGVPIFDFGYILITRILRGETRTLRSVIEHCAMDHLSHRLVWIGFSERKAVGLIYVMAVVLGVSGILLRNSDSLIDSALAVVQGLFVVVLIVVLMATAEKRHFNLMKIEVEKLRQAVRFPHERQSDHADHADKSA